MFKNKGVYLDGAANTAVSRYVYRAMKPYLTHGYVGNSHSTHLYGINSNLIITDCRETVAKCLGVNENEVFFSSGATESNNWVIKGLALHEMSLPIKERRNKILLSDIEHSSVMNPCKSLRSHGFDIEYIHVNRDGSIDWERFNQQIQDPKVLLVCMMAVNNETGIELPVQKASTMIAERNAKGLNKIAVLCDCTQALEVGGVDMMIGASFPKVDYMTFSSHKLNGPTGVGCLVARESSPLYTLLDGGSQEDGKRGGTHNLVGIVGMTAALKYLRNHTQRQHYYQLKKYLIERVHVFNQKWAGHAELSYFINNTVDNIISLGTSGITKAFGTPLADQLGLNGIAVSAGAACSGSDVEPSHVLLAFGITPEDAHNTIRVSFTPTTHKRDIGRLFSVLNKYAQEVSANENSH